MRLAIRGWLQSPQRSAGDQLRGRGRGIILGSIIALGWAAYGAYGRPLAATVVIMTLGVLVTAVLNRTGRRMLRDSRSLPSSTSEERRANDKAWRWFWLNLLGEVVMLNLALNLLRDPATLSYRIPAISVAVGLHFLPMAVFFHVRSYWAVGAAMLTTAIVCALAIAHLPEAGAEIGRLEAIANALILWSALFHGRRVAGPAGPALERGARSSDGPASVS